MRESFRERLRRHNVKVRELADLEEGARREAEWEEAEGGL